MQPRTFNIHIVRKGRGAIALRAGTAPAKPEAPPPAPARVALLLALAHDIDRKVRNGEIKDWADAARLCGFTRARSTQISDMLLLAPDIQEQLLFAMRPVSGREEIGEGALRRLVREPDWKKQRGMFEALLASRKAAMERAGPGGA